MRIDMNDNINGINAGSFVIELFDVINCAAATGSALDIKLNCEEVREISEHIKAVNWIEINEEG